MAASWNGHDEVVRTLLQGGADVNAKNNVRNQMIMMMMMIMIIILLTILMMMIMVIIVNDDDRNLIYWS